MKLFRRLLTTPANIHTEEAVGRGRGETVRRRQEEAICQERPFVERGRLLREAVC